MTRIDPAMVAPYAMVLSRLSGVMIVAPALSTVNIPVRVKVFFVMVCTAVLVPGLGASAVPAANAGAWPMLVGSEILVGFCIGLAFRWAAAGVSMAGEMMGMQMGLSIASTIDPTAGIPVLYTDALLSMAYVTFLLALNGHHEILRAFADSYARLPVGEVPRALSDPLLLIGQSASAFTTGLRLSACFLVPLMLVTVAMALVARAFPQANAFSLSYGVTLLLGLALLATLGPALRDAVLSGIGEGVRQSAELLFGY